nr:hypothetical protein [Tanacetum cinerariifolium]
GGDEVDHRARSGDSGLAGHRSAATDARAGRIVWPERPPGHRGCRDLPRRPGAESRSAVGRCDPEHQWRTGR